jgi:hypothetical protein
MDDIEHAANMPRSVEGFDPDDPAVVAALDRVRAELAGVGHCPNCSGERPTVTRQLTQSGQDGGQRHATASITRLSFVTM